jgi:tRNA pseudouridine55 synthase
MAGEGLKLARFFMEEYPSLPTYWKSYAGVFEFGRSTETGDPEGETLETKPVPALTVDSVNEAMRTFVNTRYEQMPPKFSAKKISGERASDLARKGEDPKLEPTLVTLRKFSCTAVKENQVYFEVECSKGTYVRTLAVDLATRLETAAHVSKLCRLGVGSFKIADALTLEQIEELGPEKAILDMSRASSFLPEFPLLAAEIEQIQRGKIDGVLARLSNSGFPANAYRATLFRDNTSTPVALLELSPDGKARFLRAINAG